MNYLNDQQQELISKAYLEKEAKHTQKLKIKDTEIRIAISYGR